MHKLLIFGSLNEYDEKINHLIRLGYLVTQADSKNIAEISQDIINWDFIIGEFDELLNFNKSNKEIFQLFKKISIIAIDKEHSYSINDRINAVRIGISHVVDFSNMIADITEYISLSTAANTNIPLSEYKVLIIDDNNITTQIYSAALQKYGINVFTENNPLNAVNIIEALAPHIIIMDENMPECQGHELAKVIRQFKKYRQIPIIFLTSESKVQDIADKIFSHGGDVLLGKPVKEDILISIIDIFYKKFNTIENLISKDGMTSLYNRKHMEELILREITIHKRNKNPLAVCIVDIDNFKSVNDTYGHIFGDTVIKTLSCLLSETLRTSDITGRWGGEEFIIALPNTDKKNAFMVIERIRQKFNEFTYTVPPEILSTLAQDGKKEIIANFNTSISCGLVELDAHSDNPETLIYKADEALYRAKTTGKNKVFTYNN